MNKAIEVTAKKNGSPGEAGFTLLEIICAVAILTIGLLGTAAAITSAIKFTRISRNVTTAKSMALSQIEQVHSLRDSRRLNFRQIANTGGVNNAGSNINFDGFVTTFIPVADTPGADGIFGTADDPVPPATSPNTGYSRETIITIPAGLTNLKEVTVTVKYPGSDGAIYELTCTSFLNNDLKQ